jgi:hypothetical protein
MIAASKRAFRDSTAEHLPRLEKLPVWLLFNVVSHTDISDVHAVTSIAKPLHAAMLTVGDTLWKPYVTAPQ